MYESERRSGYLPLPMLALVIAPVQVGWMLVLWRFVDNAFLQGGLTALPFVPEELTLTAATTGLVLVGLNLIFLVIVVLLPALVLYQINRLAA